MIEIGEIEPARDDDRIGFVEAEAERRREREARERE